MIEKLDGFRMPAEWEPQKSIWIAWPYNKKDWPDLFYFIPEVVAKIVKAISEDQKVDSVSYTHLTLPTSDLV